MAFITKKTQPALTTILADKAQELSVTAESKRVSADALLALASTERKDQLKAEDHGYVVGKALALLEDAGVEI